MLKRSLSLFALAFSTSIMAGSVLETTTVGENGDVLTGRVVAQDGDFSADMAMPGGHATVIFDASLSQITFVDHEDQTYLEIEKEAVQSIYAQVEAMKAQLDAMLASLPPEQRQAMESVMGNSGMPDIETVVPDIRLVRQGDGGEVNGVATERVDLFEDDVLVQRVWVARWADMEGRDDLQESMNQALAFANELIESMPLFAEKASAPFDELSALGGFPVRIERLKAGGSVESTTDVLSTRIEAVDGDAFLPPKGYTKKAFTELMGL